MSPVLARSLGYLVYGVVVMTSLVLLGALAQNVVHSALCWLRRGER